MNELREERLEKVRRGRLLQAVGHLAGDVQMGREKISPPENSIRFTVENEGHTLVIHNDRRKGVHGLGVNDEGVIWARVDQSDRTSESSHENDVFRFSPANLAEVNNTSETTGIRLETGDGKGNTRLVFTRDHWLTKLWHRMKSTGFDMEQGFNMALRGSWDEWSGVKGRALGIRLSDDGETLVSDVVKDSHSFEAGQIHEGKLTLALSGLDIAWNDHGAADLQELRISAPTSEKL